MKKHHVPAVLLAGLAIALLVVDTVITAATGERTFITDDTQGNLATTLASALWLGLTFLSMGWVVRRESHRFVAARKTARITRPILMGGLFFLGAGFLTIYPLQASLGVDEGTWFEISGLVAFAALTCVFVSALVLGLALIGRNPLGIGGRVLASIGPVIALTGLLGLVAPGMASPVYTTMVLLAGVSLLGVGVRPTGGRPTAAPAGPGQRTGELGRR